MRITLRLEGGERPREHDVLAERVEDEVELVVDGHEMDAQVTREEGEVVVEVDGETHRVAFGEDGQARVDGRQLDFEIAAFQPGGGPGADVPVPAEGQVRPPMPGKLVDVNVEEGDEVETGDVLATLEAMKMQSDIEAPRDGVVLLRDAEPGQAVEDNQILFAIGDPDDE